MNRQRAFEMEIEQAIDRIESVKLEEQEISFNPDTPDRVRRTRAQRDPLDRMNADFEAMFGREG